jgi:hypothetical protein
METALYEIKFTDGSLFRVYCHGKNQKQRLINKLNKLNGVKSIQIISNGIHLISEFEKLNK